MHKVITGQTCPPVLNGQTGDSSRLRAFVVKPAPDPPRRHKDAKNHEAFSNSGHAGSVRSQGPPRSLVSVVKFFLVAAGLLCVYRCS